MKGSSNPFPEKVKLINTHIMHTNVPLILCTKMKPMMLLVSLCFGSLTVGVVTAFLSSVSSTSIPCMSIADYHFISWGLYICIFKFYLYSRQAGILHSVHLFFSLFDRLWKNSQTYFSLFICFFLSFWFWEFSPWLWIHLGICNYV